MPIKLKGMTSIEVAIIVAIVLVIAVAVGWYLYTTFVASVGAQPQINIISAVGYQSNNSLRFEILNPGPIAVRVTHVEVAGVTLPVTRPVDIPVGEQRVASVSVPQHIARLTAGTMLSGRVLLDSGQGFPFTAKVRP